jgi:hypothetical protein
MGVDIGIGASFGIAGGKDCLCGEDLGGLGTGIEVGGGIGGKLGARGGYATSSKCGTGGVGGGYGFGLYLRVNNCRYRKLGCRPA